MLPEVWDGPKRGFDFPLHDFLADDDYHLVRRYLDEVARAWRHLPHGKVQSYARQFMAGDRRLTFRIWALVVLAAWLEHHGNARTDQLVNEQHHLAIRSTRPRS